MHVNRRKNVNVCHISGEWRYSIFDEHVDIGYHATIYSSTYLLLKTSAFHILWQFNNCPVTSFHALASEALL
jgi:hypothetical protein